jgi:hypothetical protein
VQEVVGSNPASPISERSLSVDDSERFSLAGMAVAASVLAKLIFYGDIGRVQVAVENLARRFRDF